MNKNNLLLIVLAAGVLAGLWWFSRTQLAPAPRAAAPAPTPVTQDTLSVPGAQAAIKPQLFKVEVSKGQRVSGPEIIQVREGDDVELQVTSDRADELHLHGYDLHLDLQAGVPAMLVFRAEHSGRFDYELHHAHLELGTLEVMPQ